MSKRAEFRRQKNELMKKNCVYTLTQSQIDQMKQDVIIDFVNKARNLDGFYVLTESQIKKIREEERRIALKESVDTSFRLMLSIPTQVLSEEYWKKTAPKKMPEFLEKCLKVYEKIDTGEIELPKLVGKTEKLGRLKMHYNEKLNKIKKVS